MCITHSVNSKSSVYVLKVTSCTICWLVFVKRRHSRLVPPPQLFDCLMAITFQKHKLICPHLCTTLQEISILLDLFWMQSFVLSIVASLLCVCVALPLYSVKQTHRPAALYTFMTQTESRRERQWCNLVTTLWITTSHPVWFYWLEAAHSLPKGWHSEASWTQQNKNIYKNNK